MIGAAPACGPQSYASGLEGLVAGDTAISDIDGERGQLIYRGYPIEELAAAASFEEVSHLVLFGQLPDPARLREWLAELVRWRHPPQPAFDALQRVPIRSHPLAQYRTMLTVAACHMPEPENTELDAQWRRPARILSWTAALAAAAIRHLQGLEPVAPSETLGYSANFLYQTLGRLPPRRRDPGIRREPRRAGRARSACRSAGGAVRHLDRRRPRLGRARRHGGSVRHPARRRQPARLRDARIARRTPSCQTVGSTGDRGGEAGSPASATASTSAPIRGCAVLEPHARAVLAARGLEGRWETYLALRDEVEAGLAAKRVYANVDSITGLVYDPIGLPSSAFPIPFCLAIQTGWMAHCLEYLPDGKMLSPGLVYLKQVEG